LNFESGYYKIIVLTLLVLLACHLFDLYDPSHFDDTGELYFRLLLVPGLLAFLLAAVGARFPNFVLGNFSLDLGLIILAVALLAWRSAYAWLILQPYLRERVYVLGTGERAERLVQGLKGRSEFGIDVVSWTGDLGTNITKEEMAAHLLAMADGKTVHRIIVAMKDRRGNMPTDELLHLRKQGAVHIEEATSWLEKISGKIEVEHLNPSWIIFEPGFHFNDAFRIVRRLLSLVVGLFGLVLATPFIPLIGLAIRLDSAGPVFYSQERVGRGGEKVFHCYKFRTMRQDAEADVGPTWADDNDPRITRVGRFLRSSRLDEIPQLLCVLKGDMAFVGPRPERPEFVKWLTQEIPYYGMRHLVRPGITGWAQIRYHYGNTVEDAKEKLQYDLFYIKNASIGLDVLILFQTIKIVLLGRGAR
jgi:sugar transferase (PEP-CTERM system associated)